jgi:hypothetical protein
MIGLSTLPGSRDELSRACNIVKIMIQPQTLVMPPTRIHNILIRYRKTGELINAESNRIRTDFRQLTMIVYTADDHINLIDPCHKT